MRTAKALFIITAAFLAAPSIALAEQASDPETPASQPAKPEPAKKPGLHLKPNAKWHILGHSLGAPVYLLFMTSVHESGHAAIGAAAGLEVVSFKPYPHMEDLGGGRQFVWGSTMMRGEITPKREAWMLAGPSILDFTMFATSDLLLTYGVSSDSVAAPFILTGGMICPLVDFLWNVNGPSATNDTTRLGKIIGMPKWSIMLIGDALAAVAVWRILHHGRNIFFEPERSQPAKTSFMIMPTFGVDRENGDSRIGLSAVGRF